MPKRRGRGEGSIFGSEGRGFESLRARQLFRGFCER